MKTIEQYRKSDYKVRVTHIRPVEVSKNKIKMVRYSRHKKELEGKVMPTRGKTIVEVTSPEGIDGFGEAGCHHDDNFCYKAGSRAALKIAIEEIESVIKERDEAIRIQKAMDAGKQKRRERALAKLGSSGITVEKANENLRKAGF